MNGDKITDSARHLDPIVRSASDWLVAQDRGLTAAQQIEFDRWLDEDIRHAEVYGQMKLTWSWLGDVSESASAVHADKNKDTSDSAEVMPRTSRIRRGSWVAVSLAAAAVLALGFFGMRYFQNRPFSQSMVTDVSGSKDLRLPDGSVIQLNTNSALLVDFTRTERRVRLAKGEAHFDVAKNAGRPFVVSAGGVDVRAVGTAFNVRLQTASVEVLVTEGRVRVDDAASGQSVLTQSAAPKTASTNPTSEPLLTAGQRAVVRTGESAQAPSAPIATVATVTAPEVQGFLAWRERQLQFVNRPISEIVDEFNRVNRHKLVIKDARLATKRFGGTFPADDYEGFVRVLEQEFGVVSNRSEGETVLRLP